MRAVGSFHLILFFCRLHEIFAEQKFRVIKPDTGDSDDTHHPAYNPPVTPTPSATPSLIPSAFPSSFPTSSPTFLCIGFNFEAKFSSPAASGSKGVTGKLKGFYDNKDKATLELKIKFGDFKFNDVKIKEGDLIDWSVNTMWDNPGKSGWNNKCREGRTGLHYDPTVACSSLSENLITPSARRRLVERRLAPKVPYCVQDNGRTVKAEDYACNPKKKQNTCERGDLSGKLGQLVVKKNSSDKLLVKFKGTDTFFPRKNVAEMEDTDWSIVLSKGGNRFLCAQFVLECI